MGNDLDPTKPAHLGPGRRVSMATDTGQPYSRRSILIDGLSFDQVGEWQLAPCGTKLTCPGPGRGANKAPSVYIIASVEPIEEALLQEKAIVLYVGKASDGWRKRRGLHVGNRDRLFHQVVIGHIKRGRRVLVFERLSGWSIHYGFHAPTCEAEELALMARFSPEINDPADVARAKRFQDLSVSTRRENPKE